MEYYLFIIPNLHEKVTGSNKRAFNLALEFSLHKKVVIVSNKRIQFYSKRKIQSEEDFSFLKFINQVFLKRKYSKWFSDSILWSLLPIRNLVFTLHDMKEITNFNRRGLLKMLLLKFLIYKAKYKVTVSTNQKKIIKNYFGRNFVVSLNSVSSEWHNESKNSSNEIKKKFGLNNKYIVYVSNFTPHKKCVR